MTWDPLSNSNLDPVNPVFWIALDYQSTFFVDQLPACSDNLIIELILVDPVTGAAIPGGTWYSKLFAWCNGMIPDPVFSITFPTLSNSEGFPSLVFAEQTNITLNWTATKAPLDQAWDFTYSGMNMMNYEYYPTYDPVTGAITAEITPVPPTSPLRDAGVLFNVNQDGTGVQYSYTYTMPRLASACSVKVSLYATGTPDVGMGWGDYEFSVIDPNKLNTSIAISKPTYNQKFKIGDTVTIEFSGKNLLASDTIYLKLMNTDTEASFTYYIGPTDTKNLNWISMYGTPLYPLFDPTTTNTFSVVLGPEYSNFGGYIFGGIMDPGINYVATLEVYRSTFTFLGSSSYFMVADPALDPTISISGDFDFFPVTLFWGSSLTFSYVITSYTCSALKVDLWLSTAGFKDPNSDMNITMLSYLSIDSSSGTATVTIPSDPSLPWSDSSFFFLGVMCAHNNYVAASSGYFGIEKPSLTLTSPPSGYVGKCGENLDIEWTFSGFPYTNSLTFVLFRVQGSDESEYSTVGASVDPTLLLRSVTLPSSMTRGTYVVKGFNGASWDTSTAKGRTAYFGINCRPQFTVHPWEKANIKAGEKAQIQYTISNFPEGGFLSFDLINNASGAVVMALSNGEPNSGLFEFSTDPDVAFSNLVLKITDNSDLTLFGLSPNGLFTTLPKAQLSVSVPLVWTAGKPLTIALRAVGGYTGSTCSLDLWSYNSDFSGSKKVLTIASAIDCKSKSFSTWSPPTTLQSLYMYWIVFSDSVTSDSVRSDPPSRLKAGVSPPGLNVLRTGSLDPTSTASCPTFPTTSAWAAPALCAKTCAQCVAAGGVWLVGVDVSFSLQFNPWVGTVSNFFFLLSHPPK